MDANGIHDYFTSLAVLNGARIKYGIAATRADSAPNLALGNDRALYDVPEMAAVYSNSYWATIGAMLMPNGDRRPVSAASQLRPDGAPVRQCTTAQQGPPVPHGFLPGLPVNFIYFIFLDIFETK